MNSRPPCAILRLHPNQNQEMAPAVLQSGIHVSKEPSIHQRIQNTIPEVPHDSIPRIPAEPVNENQKFITSGESNTKRSLAGKIIFHAADSYEENIQRLIDSIVKPASAKGETSCEGHDIPPSKKRRLFFIPIRNDLSDSELTWHAKNLEKLLHNHKDSNEDTPRILIVRAKDRSARAVQNHTDYNKLLVPTKLGLTEGSRQKYGQPTLCTSELEVAEVNEVTGGDKSAPAECCVPQSDVFEWAEPPVPGQQYPARVHTQTPTPLEATVNDSKNQSEESEKANNKRCPKTKNFTFRAIAENLDVDGCIPGAGSRFSASEEAQRKCVVPDFLLDRYNCKVPAKLEPKKNRDPEGALHHSTPENLGLPSPKDSSSALCTQNLGVDEADEVSGHNKSAPTGCCAFQNEVPVEAYPRGHSERQYPIEIDKCFQVVDKHTQPETTTNGSDKRPPEPVKLPPKNKNFDFRAIAENLDVDGGFISNNTGSTCCAGNLQTECVVSEVLLDCNDCQIPVTLDPSKKCDPKGASCASTPGNMSLPAYGDSPLTVYPPKLGLAEANKVTEGDKSAPNGYSAVDKCCQAFDDYTPAQCKTIPNVVHKEPGNLEKTVVRLSPVTNNFDFRAVAKNLDVDKRISSNAEGGRYSANEDAQRECVTSQIPVNSELDIPSVVLEFPAKSSLNPNEVASKRQKRKLKHKQKFSKRLRSEYLERSPGVTLYASFTHLTGGKVTVLSRPEPVKEEETSTPQPEKGVHKYDAIADVNQDSRDISADDENERGICFNQQDMGSGSVDGHEHRRVSTDAVDTGPVPANGLSGGTDSLSTDEYSNNGISATVSMEASGAFPNDTIDPVEALLNSKNKLNEKVASTDATFAEEFGKRAKQVVEFCDSQELGGSLGNLSHVDPENMKVASSDSINAVEALLKLQRNLNEAVNSDAKLADNLGEKAEQVLEFNDPQELEASPGASLNLDHENVTDVPISFCCYLRSLVRPGGFLSHPQMKFKCFFCGKLFPRYIDLEGHSVETHCEAWENIRNSYLRILVPYLPEGFLEGHPQLQFKCIFCSRLFSCCGDLEEHLSERHCGDRPYACPFCSERFNNASPYSSHLNGHVYLNDYPSYTCNACCACFSSQWQLDLHTPTHERNSSPIIVDL